jgi:hypothetical protein
MQYNPLFEGKSKTTTHLNALWVQETKYANISIYINIYVHTYGHLYLRSLKIHNTYNVMIICLGIF